MSQEYVVGFAFGQGSHKVALIRKERPEWQRGKLNGIGGHVEEDETPDYTIVREFEEETGVFTEDWQLFVVMDFPGATIYFFRTWLPILIFQNEVHTTTDEQIVKLDYRELGQVGVIPNLRWLVPLAAYIEDDYEPIYVKAARAEVKPS